MKLGQMTVTISLGAALRRRQWRSRMAAFYGEEQAPALEARADELARTTTMDAAAAEWAAEREKLDGLAAGIRALAQEQP